MKDRAPNETIRKSARFGKISLVIIASFYVMITVVVVTIFSMLPIAIQNIIYIIEGILLISGLFFGLFGILIDKRKDVSGCSLILTTPTLCLVFFAVWILNVGCGDGLPYIDPATSSITSLISTLGCMWRTSHANPVPVLTPGPHSGEVLFSESFDNNERGWGIGAYGQDPNIQVSETKHALEIKSDNYLFPQVELPAKFPSAVDISFDVVIEQNFFGRIPSYGVYCNLHKTNGTNTYRFRIDPPKNLNTAGTISIGRIDDVNVIDFIQQPATTLFSGKQKNRIRAICTGNQFELFINGTRLAAIRDDNFKINFDVARITLFVYASETNAILDFDNLVVRVPGSNANIDPATPMPTPTPEPTLEIHPTPTTDIAATQNVENFTAKIIEYYEKGYISNTNGHYSKLEDFEEDWSEFHNHHRLTPTDDKPTDFVLTTDVTWDSGSTSQYAGGCGFAFRLQNNENRNYLAFIAQDGYVYSWTTVGELISEKGKGHYGQAEQNGSAKLTIITEGPKYWILVNDQLIKAFTTFETKLNGKNLLAYVIVSSTPQGMNCAYKNTLLWTMDRP